MTLVESLGSFRTIGKPYYGTSFAAAYASAMVARLIVHQGTYGSVQPDGLLLTLKGQAETSNFASHDVMMFGNGVLRV